VTAILNSSAKLLHTSPVPAGVTREAGLKMLHDHEHFIKCDPHMIKFEAVTPSEVPVLPEGITPLAGGGGTKVFKVTDKVAALPAGLWDSDVVSTYEFTSIAEGVFVRIRSPLSVMMETVWTLKGEGERSLEMVEDVTISCSRLLVGVIKGSCESNWKSIHAKMLEGIKA
jgi:hypothetical protein